LKRVNAQNVCMQYPIIVYMPSSPPQVTTFIAEIYDSSSVILYWNGNLTLNRVSLQKSTNDVNYITFATDISTNQYSISNLKSNIYYYFRIIPYDILGNSGNLVKTNIFLNYDLNITSFYTGKSNGNDMPLYWKGSYYGVDLQYKLYEYDDTAYSEQISVIGTNTYTITGLDENKEYEFKIIPKYASGTRSDNIYTIVATTEYTANFSSFILVNISSFEAVLNWVGKYSFIKFQYSTTGVGFKTFSTAISDSNDVSGTITMTNLLPYTLYYFRAIPYNTNLCAGTISDVVSGETLSGIKTFIAPEITQTYCIISWIGSYITAYLYKSSDGGVTFDFLETYTDISGSYVDNDVSVYTSYYYYLQPYGETLPGISSEIHVLTDYYSSISASIANVTTNSISVFINSNGSRFEKSLIQISPDNGVTYYDSSIIYNSGQTYTLTSASGLGNFTQNTIYSILITPYSLYNIPGTNPFMSTIATLGYISTFDINVNSLTTVYLTWSGYYTTSRIEYSTDSTFSTGVTTITTSQSSYTISSIDTKFTTYYFRIMPININGVNGSYSNVLYNPTVNTLYYNNITSLTATLIWSGTNTSTTVQTSTDGVTFSDLIGYIQTTETSAIINLNRTTVYVRIIPYYNNIIGTTTNSIYAPYSNGISITNISSSPSNITFSINGGVYKYVKLQYTTTSSSTSYTDISTNIVSSTITVGTSLLPTLNTQNTTYYYTIIPYSVGYQSGAEINIVGSISSSVFNPSISSIYISDITASSGRLKLNWSGTFSRVILYESTNNNLFSPILTTNSPATTSYTFVPANNILNAPNYYKIIPVSDLNGVFSDMVYSPVITDISVVSLTSSNITLGMSGTYGTLTLQYSTISPTTGFSDLSTNITGKSITVNNLTPASVAYYFRAIPYSPGGGTSASYKITGIISSTIYNPIIKTISITNIASNALTLNWTGVFGNVTLQSSSDNYTFSNLPTGNVYITGTSKTLYLPTTTTNYYRISPYYISDKTGNYIPGLNSSVVYNPIITNIYIGSITNTSIGVFWTGTYDYVKLQYSRTGTSYTDISSILQSDNITINSSHISDLNTQYQTYYFRVVPYSIITNTDNTISIATGLTSQPSYSPTINSITISSVDSQYTTLKWSGTYDNITIQSSSDGNTFSDLYTGITSSYKIINTIGTNTTYYRIKPYNNTSPSINGITSTSVYIPTISSIDVTSVTKTPATINLIWTGGTRNKVSIQYSSNNTTFTDLVKNLTGNTTTITSSNISGLNTQTGTYYFRAIPYSYGYYNGAITYDISGINTNSVYNATISTISSTNPSDNSTNTIYVNYTGTYSNALLYYGTIGNITTNSITITTPNTGSNVTTSVPDLSSNTKYEFEIYPYNATNVPGIMSSVINRTTISTIYGLNFAYKLSISTAYSIGLSWINNGYTKIEIYNALNNVLVNTFYSISNAIYNSSGIETLSPNSSYNYYAKVYDSINNVEQCSTITTYTLATADLLGLSYSNVSSNDSITITWNNSGYTTFSIYNYTLYGDSPSSGKVVTITSASNITSYNSYNDIGDTLQYNTSYVYRITLTNMVGELVYTNFTVTTLASATLSVSTDTSKFSSSSIPLVISGSYSGFKIYINDDSTGSSIFNNSVIFDGSATTNVIISSPYINTANNQYSFKLQPYNSVGLYSSVGTPVSAKTLGKITYFNITSQFDVDSSSVNLYLDGSFATVAIESSTSSNFSNVFVSKIYTPSVGNIYNFSSLKQNTLYYFRATPINQPLLNGVDVYGTTTSDNVSNTTFGTISYFTIGSLNDISSSAISLSWDGSYSAIHIQISYDGGVTYNTLNNTYYGKYAIITGLNPYTQYYFQGLPMNDVMITSNVPSQSATAQTLGTITSFYTYSITDSSNIKLFYDGSYDAVVLEKSTSSDFTTNNTITRIGSPATNVIYTISNLESNKKYYFRIRPISYPLLNGVDACGNIVVNDVSGTTYGKITTISIGDINDVYNHGIPVKWDGSFNKVYIYYSKDGSNYTLDANSPYTNNYNIIYNLDTYMQYYFVAIPSNSVDVISDVSSYVVTAKTLGTINSFYKYSIVDNSSINIYVDGSYTAVCIECFGGSTGFISRRFIANNNNIYYYTGLDSNATYTFLATPLDDPFLDGVDVSGTTIDNNVTGTTWGNITTFATKTSDISATYIPLTWSGVFSSLYLEYSDNSSFTYDISSYIVYNSNGTTVRDLSASKLYYFRVTPINTLGVYGKTSNIISDYTLGSSSTLVVSSNDVYSVQLYITGGSYATADVNLSLNESMTQYTVYSRETYATLNNNYYTIRDLSANTKYYFTLTPYNAAGVKGANSNMVYSTTLGNLTSFGLNATTYATTSSTIAVKWTGIYANVYLEDAASSISSFSPVGYITDTSTNVTNLAPNTRYYFRATPINSAGNIGTTRGGSGDISDVTLATITNRSTTTIGDVSVNIAFDGSFNTIQLYTLDNAINQTYGTSVRNSGTDISGLMYFTYYTVYLRTYNLNNVLSDTSSIIFTTLPKITSFTITRASINTNYIPVSWDGSFNSVKFQWSKSTFVVASRPGVDIYEKSVDSPTLTTNITNLSENTYYYIVAIPYSNTGALGAAGYMLSELSACTLPKLTSFAINTSRSTTYYSIPISWAGYYKYVVAEYSTNNTVFTSLGSNYDSSTNLLGLDANKRYYFRATPVNLADVSGTTIIDISSVTLGNMTRSSYSAYDTSANFVLDGSFSSIRVYNSTISFNTTYTYVNGGISTGTDISGLLPNATYTFTMTPINSAGISRTDPSNITIKTLPKIYAFNATATDTSNITLTWDGSFNSVNIYSSDTASSYTGSASSFVSTIKTTAVNNLLSNKRYYFKITPIGTAGNGYSVIDISAITYSKITQLITSAYYDTSAVVSFDGSFASVNITVNNVTTTYTSQRTTGLDISNLTPYTSYTVSSTTTNSVITSSGLSTSFTTLPKISTLSSSAIDFSSVNVYWSYSGNAPTNVKLEWNKTDDTFTKIDNSGIFYSSPIYVSDLSANTRYYFRATPYGTSGNGYSVKTNVLTNANAGVFVVSSVYDTSAVITFNGVYSSIDISVNNITTTYNSSSGTTGTDISNLTPNKTYLATSIVKVSDGSTSVGNNTTFTTLPKLSVLSVSAIDNSSVNVSWTYVGNAPTSVKLIWNTTGGTYATTDSSGTFTSSPVFITGLSLANARYYFQATPIASAGSGYPIKDASDVTYGKLTSLYTSAYYDTSAVIGFDGSFASVNITTNGITTTYTTARNTGTDISNLLPGTTYSVTTSIKNSAGYTVAGNTISFTTLSKIRNFYAIPFDISSINVYWTVSGPIDSVNIIWNTTGSTYAATDSSGTFTSSPAFITGLSLANTRYYFQITPYTSNVGYGFPVKDASNVTYGTLTSLYTSAYYDTSAVIAFDGSFASIDISTNGISRTYTTARNTGTDITSLLPGTTYTVTTSIKNITGYNVSGGTTSFTTRSKIMDFSANAIDSSSIYVYWRATGAVDNVTIVWNTTGGTYATTDSSAVFTTYPAFITGLSLANTRYYFQITPYTNSIGYGNAVNDASNVTYGKLTSLYTSAYYDTSAVIGFDGSFASVNITTNGITTTYTTARNTGTDISNLLPGTTYSVTTVVKNSAGYTVAGNTISFTTLSKIRNFSAIPFDSSSINVYWTVSGPIDSVNIIWNTTGSTYAATDSSGTFTSSPAFITGLSLANTRYYFQITPYTSNVGYGFPVNDASNVTYGTLTSLYTSAYYDTSAVIAFDGSFASIDISTNGISRTYTTARNTGTDITSLIPGTTYTVTTSIKNITGYNVSGGTTSFTTRSKIMDFSANAIDSSSIYVYWRATGAVDNVTIVWNTTGGTYAATDSSAIFTTYPALVTGLSLANAKYYFQITPYTNNIGYGNAVKDASDVTYGSLTSFYVSSVSDTAAVVSFDGSFTSVDISANGISKTYTSQRTTGTDISNLIIGQTYTVTSVIKNVVGKTIIGNTITFTTTPKFTTLTATPLDSSCIYISWTSQSAISANIIWNTTGVYDGVTDGSGTFSTQPVYITGLLKNTTYYFRAVPIYSGVNGFVKDVSATTLIDFSGIIFVLVSFT